MQTCCFNDKLGLSWLTSLPFKKCWLSEILCTMVQTVRRFMYHRSCRICSLAHQHRWWDSKLCHLYAGLAHSSSPYKTFNTWRLHASMSLPTLLLAQIHTISLMAQIRCSSGPWVPKRRLLHLDYLYYILPLLLGILLSWVWFNWIFCRFTCVFPLFQVGFMISSYVQTQTQAWSIFIFVSSVTYLWLSGVI